MVRVDPDVALVLVVGIVLVLFCRYETLLYLAGLMPWSSRYSCRS
jgi:hypothetical protein